MAFTYGKCGHPLYKNRCRVCPRNTNDRDSNPIGEARLCHFETGDVTETIAAPSDWWTEREEWQGREDEANACEHTVEIFDGHHADNSRIMEIETYWSARPPEIREVERTIARICPPESRRDVCDWQRRNMLNNAMRTIINTRRGFGRFEDVAS